MKNERYLTKSRYKLGLECPTKLYYTSKREEYADQSFDDPFMAALAEGGFQVGELAKYTFAGGHDIKSLGYEGPLKETEELMKQDEVIIYEAAFKYKNFFIRADVIEKKGNLIRLHEVKAKSFLPGNTFLNQGGFIDSKWQPYLYDVAFQKYVIQKAVPGSVVRAHLVMVDKSAECPIDGLNQKFKIVTNEAGIKEAKLVGELTEKDLYPSMLCIENVDSVCDMIYEGTDMKQKPEKPFEENLYFLAEHYAKDLKISSGITKKCKDCQFRATDTEKAGGLKSGFEECWKEKANMTDDDFKKQSILELWNYRKTPALIDSGIYYLGEIPKDMINPKETDDFGLSPSERQWMQIEKYKNQDYSDWIDIDNLHEEMKLWKFPLHFIDFETSAVAIPFFKKRRPYEGVAFQFSHHIVHEDGRVEHIGEFLNTEPGYFPNIDFVRALKKELENDEGTIFRYAPHENTYLNMIYNQILDDKENISDQEELRDFIKTITHHDVKGEESWCGSRDMVDMWQIVKKFYYHPRMKGSNSIKYVLPAMLNSSEYLQNKYSKPIYGASDGIPSKNFKNWIWVEKDENGDVKDPYKLLPKLFSDASDKDRELLLSNGNNLANGGAALTAYGKLQFEQITDYERKELQNALLKYCELDTMAMVMIYEGWREMVK